MKTLKKVVYKGWNCLVQQSYYESGRRPAIFLIDADDGEPIATCTVNIPNAALADDEVFIKDYSENEGMSDFLIAEGIIEPTGKRVEMGYVQIEVFKLKVG